VGQSPQLIEKMAYSDFAKRVIEVSEAFSLPSAAG